jgi:hypothetical protein
MIHIEPFPVWLETLQFSQLKHLAGWVQLPIDGDVSRKDLEYLLQARPPCQKLFDMHYKEDFDAHKARGI